MQNEGEEFQGNLLTIAHKIFKRVQKVTSVIPPSPPHHLHGRGYIIVLLQCYIVSALSLLGFTYGYTKLKSNIDASSQFS